MTTFGAIGIASTGLTVYRKWLDAVSDNLANMSTATSTTEDAYQAKYVIAQEIATQDGGGVQVAGIALGDAEGRMVYEPENPLADEAGYVRYPDVDMSSQMTQLIMAQRGYQANAAVVDRAKATYEAALQIGRN
ncbi:flagellar basal body rod protein FlgC [Cellulomonas chengniuliangii]|uniref:Flagellar basal-body rod protein FlgC n=1 Tax=Cellulomonas chengniuliangii TaxID=2968084 RepID=A0ABY5L2Z5_9CELL|nr:flagellar basal body rod protein FlgC [Cellulomonas chengniuliangii]MCC2307271.1 flagellar basal body rod protein FlgC [Cellulomonas chengniuliangii]MCC2317833.1 flagellar basal body rod protein FlgC [Cellulomonas chengniuliangii]UUI75937.1 flagellar basal body rod protein FlgC [Cellulomonas chengniuliangii]